MKTALKAAKLTENFVDIDSSKTGLDVSVRPTNCICTFNNDEVLW